VNRVPFYVQPVPDDEEGGWSAGRLLKAQQRVLTTVLAAVPGLSAMTLFETDACVVVHEGGLAIEVRLAPTRQGSLSWDGVARRMSTKRLQETALAELRSLRASIASTQRGVDILTAELRAHGLGLLRTLEREERALLDLVASGAKRELEFSLPGVRETLCLPQLEKHLLDEHAVRLRMQIRSVGPASAEAISVEALGPNNVWQHLDVGSKTFALNSDGERFSESERRCLARAYESRAPLEAEVRLLRSVASLRVVGGRMEYALLDCPVV
jgi:hypothetical protein